jgi:tRNA A-37 threonylcarbamoyl transferase component Bud32/tetratricopeptide (TPR) repeat protein
LRSPLPADRWSKIEALFLAGADLLEDQRDAFLDEHCGDDLQLREQVLSLLHHDTTATDPPVLEALQSSAASVIDEDDEFPEGWMLGPYRIEREIARGGMAVVYLASRADGEFQKQVAVKLIKRGMDTATVIQRLRRERHILAALEHPSISRLLDGGTAPDGRPWIAMEFIEGLPIRRFCNEHHLSIEERCALIEKVCDAVAYAHRHLVVHRDLKPSNILVGPDGNPKLLDFGIAKLLGPPATDGDDEPLTRGPAHPLTPEYASPEQIAGAPVTTASDIYSLGVILYELLTGQRPGPSTPHAEPTKPSAIPTLPARTRRRLAGDLDNIVLKALSPDVSRRYGTAEQLAQELRRHLEGLPVEARGATLLYRTGKFLNRHRAAVSAAFVVAALAITATVIDLEQAHAARERFDQLRGFARTVLVDLHEQLRDIPGTAKARQALVAYVDDYLKRVAAQHAGDDTALATEFATTYLRLGEMQGPTPEAIASFENGRRLLEQKRRKAGSNPSDATLTARLLAREGSTLIELGRAPEGILHLQEAAALAEANGWNADAELVKAFARWRIARLRRIQNRLAEAEHEARASIAISEEVLRRGFPDKEAYEALTGARNVLGGVQRRQGRWQEGMETYRKVLDSLEQRAREDPGSGSLQRELARSHQILGDMVTRMRNHDENQVRLHVREAIAISDRLVALDPGERSAQTNLAEYLSSAAETLHDPKDAKEALADLHRALPILEGLLKTEPGDTDLRLYYGLAETDMGQFLARSGSNTDSILWFRRGLANLHLLTERDPANLVNLYEFMTAEERLSLILARTGQGSEALSMAQDAIAKARPLAADLGATLESARELPRAYGSMGAVCAALGKSSESRTWYQWATSEWDKLRAKGLSAPDDEEDIAEARKRAGFKTGTRSR